MAGMSGCYQRYQRCLAPAVLAPVIAPYDPLDRDPGQVFKPPSAAHIMGTDKQTYLYCAAYGNGSFIVRGFGPEAFQLNGRRGEENAAVHKAAGPGSPVTQDIAVSVTGDKVNCSINGTVVGSYDKAAVVGVGKLKSTDGIYGIRFAHNTEGTVTGLTMTKN